MKQVKSIIILFFLFSNMLYSQGEIELYENVYSTADSLIRIKKIRIIDSTIFITAIQLDTGHPSEYLVKAAELLSESKFNESAFLYNLGLLRYSYYNSVNPEYKKSEDGAVLSSLEHGLGRPINMYLKTDLDNFISIYKMAVDFYESNEFNFYKKNYNREKFCAPANAFYNLIEKVQNEKETYIIKWKEETVKMKEYIKIGRRN